MPSHLLQWNFSSGFGIHFPFFRSGCAEGNAIILFTNCSRKYSSSGYISNATSIAVCLLIVSLIISPFCPIAKSIACHQVSIMKITPAKSISLHFSSRLSPVFARIAMDDFWLCGWQSLQSPPYFFWLCISPVFFYVHPVKYCVNRFLSVDSVVHFPLLSFNAASSAA